MTYMPVTRTLSLLGCSQREIRYILENLITVVNTPLGHRLKGHLCSTIACVRSALPLPGGLLRSIARRATACAKVAIRRARETIDPKLRRHLRSELRDCKAAVLQVFVIADARSTQEKRSDVDVDLRGERTPAADLTILGLHRLKRGDHHGVCGKRRTHETQLQTSS
jgi:hypothetical protein